MPREEQTYNNCECDYNSALIAELHLLHYITCSLRSMLRVQTRVLNENPRNSQTIEKICNEPSLRLTYYHFYTELDLCIAYIIH